jgi:uncharacterized SAM-binding protein YcdF (DUF218 family)
MSLFAQCKDLLLKTQLSNADAIVVLEGDRFRRLEHGVSLYKQGLAPLIVISGGLAETEYSIPAKSLKAAALKANVPEAAIIVEERSQNTKEQAAAVLAIAKEKGWRHIIVVASDEHEVRALLTFLRKATGMGLRIMLTVASPGGSNPERQKAEIDKIEEYKKIGHVAAYEDGIKYLKSL